MDEFEKETMNTEEPAAPEIPEPQEQEPIEPQAEEIPEAPAQETAEAQAEETPEAPAQEPADVQAEETPEAPAQEPTEAQAETMEDKLVQELEGIRDLLQKELDQATGEPLIQPLDAYEEETANEEEAPIPEEERCTCCGEKRRDTSFGDDYPYCKDCRDLMLSNPIRISAILFTVLMFVVAGLSLYFCTRAMDDYMTLFDAEIAYRDTDMVDAASQYYSYLSTKITGDSVSKAAVKHLSDIYMHLGYPDKASQLVQKHLSEAELKLPWNAKYRKYNTLYDELQTTVSALSDIMMGVLQGEKFDYAEKSAALDALLQPDENGECPYSPIFIEYYRFVLMSEAGRSKEEQLQQLQKVESMDDGDHTWLYLINALSIASQLGDVDLAKTYFDRCIAANRQEVSAYAAYANVYRFTKTPDVDQIFKVADEAKEHASSSMLPSYQTIYAIGYLLKGDNQAAMQAMETYISALYSSQQQADVRTFNLYALCAAVTGDETTYSDIESMFAASQIEISPLVQKVKAGKMTVKAALTDNGGDI